MKAELEAMEENSLEGVGGNAVPTTGEPGRSSTCPMGPSSVCATLRCAAHGNANQ